MDLVKKAERMGADSAEVFFIEEKEYSFTLIGEQFSKEFSETRGYGIRVVKDGRLGFSYFNSESDAEKAIKSALSSSKFSEKLEFDFPEKAEYKKLKTFDRAVLDFNEEKGAEIRDEIVNAIPKNCSLLEAIFSWGYAKILLENSNGVHASEPSSEFFCHVSAHHADVSGEYSDVSIHPIDFAAIAGKASQLAIDMKNPKTIDGHFRVVFEHTALLPLLETFLEPAIDGESAMRGASYLCGKLGEAISTEQLTVYDNPFKGVAKSAFDGEGYPSVKKNIIDKGIFKNFLYDAKTACKMNAEAGNAVRESYSVPPSIGISNIEIERGKDGNIEDDCIIVHSFFGEHTTNELTGDFSLQLMIAFDKRNGKNDPVKNVVMSGNFFEMLKNIYAIENKKSEYANLISPRIGFDGVRIAKA
ncbi:MAG: TldD/PmbA family protein [Candidatus Micrarchaeia archaeon]